MTARPIRSVAVAGNGFTAWSAAAALRRRIPSLSVTVIGSPAAPNALADRMISTLPSIQGFHADIGLTSEDTISRAGSALRLGSLFEGWAPDLPDYVHAYGAYGTSFAGVPFHQLWLRERERQQSSVPPFDRFSPTAEMARSGKMPRAMSTDVQAGLQLSLPKYRQMMRAYALHLGVSEAFGQVVDVNLRAKDGMIESLQLDRGEQFVADLFVDCTGPSALLRSKLRPGFIDWSHWLPCNRIIVGERDPIEEAQTLDLVRASTLGWCWRASSLERSSFGMAYSSTHAHEEDLEHDLLEFGCPESGETASLNQGRWTDLWVGNCVAIGDAAVSVEPLEWTNLHLAHSQIDRVITMMPGADFAPIELVEFNRQCAAEADRIRDFLCMHYFCSSRTEPFWRDASSVKPPESLAHTLSLFGERGRLPYYEEETFSRDSWLAVLLGQGFEPRAIDPRADIVSSAEAARAFAAIRSPLTLSIAPPSLAHNLAEHGIR